MANAGPRSALRLLDLGHSRVLLWQKSCETGLLRGRGEGWTVLGAHLRGQLRLLAGDLVQLRDVDDGDRTRTAAGQFAANIGKMAGHVRLFPSAKLTSEASDGVAPMQLHKAGMSAAIDRKAGSYLPRSWKRPAAKAAFSNPDGRAKPAANSATASRWSRRACHALVSAGSRVGVEGH